MILLDTSGLLAALDSSEPDHREAANSLAEAAPPRLLSPFVLAELDYMVRRRIGPSGATALLREVARGAYRLEPFTGADVGQALDIVERFADLCVSLADASIVVLADRHDATDVLTLDERHFRSLPGPRGKPLRLLPSDLAA